MMTDRTDAERTTATPKLRTLIGGGLVFWCPGCQHTHAVNSHPNGPRWDYNGDAVRPTFSPSLLVTYERPGATDRCHSFVRSGNIQFLGDSTHALAGQTVPLPDWPYAPGTYGGIQETSP